jgi:hypothetical protein
LSRGPRKSRGVNSPGPQLRVIYVFGFSSGRPGRITAWEGLRRHIRAPKNPPAEAARLRSLPSSRTGPGKPMGRPEIARPGRSCEAVLSPNTIMARAGRRSPVLGDPVRLHVGPGRRRREISALRQSHDVRALAVGGRPWPGLSCQGPLAGRGLLELRPPSIFSLRCSSLSASGPDFFRGLA